MVKTAQLEFNSVGNRQPVQLDETRCCSKRLKPNTSRATAFWTRWSASIAKTVVDRPDLRGVITTRRYTNPRLPLPYTETVGHDIQRQ